MAIVKIKGTKYEQIRKHVKRGIVKICVSFLMWATVNFFMNLFVF